MFSLIRKLRKPLPTTHHGRSARRTRSLRPILGVEPLDQRLLPSVTASLSNGVLVLKGDAGDDTVTVGYSTNSSAVVVDANFHDGSSNKAYNLSAVQKIQFTGGGGRDGFENDTAIAMEADGRGSHAKLVGGSGSNTFLVDSNDSIVPGTGPNANNVTYGLVGGHLYANGLQATGPLAVSLSLNPRNPLGPNKILTLSGPGGAGFQITGTWVRSGAGDSSTFTASGTLTLKSALGNISLAVPKATPLTVSYKADPDVPNAGVVTSATLSGIPNLSLNSTGLLKNLSNELGLTVQLPGVSWGTALGSDLADLNLPVDSGVPYLYASVSSGFSASFGGAAVSTKGETLAFVFDPADPSVAVRIGNFAVGGSIKGYIPFTPWAQPTAVNEHIIGNLFGEADNIPLGDLPITLSGSVVLNLDAQGTGNPLAISGNTFSKLLKGQVNLTSLATNALNDIAIGVNGNVSLGYDLNAFDITLPVGDATAMYTPGYLAFAADTPDPFANTPLEQGGVLQTVVSNVSHTPTYSVEGSISWDSNGVSSWQVTADADNVPLALGFTASHAEVTIATTDITVDAQISSLLGLATFDLKGYVDYQGHFALSTAVNADLGPFSAQFIFVFSNVTGSVQFDASLSASFDVGIGTIDLNANLAFSVDAGGSVHVSGNGDASAGPFDVGVSFDDSGFTVDLPDPFPNITVTW